MGELFHKRSDQWRNVLLSLAQRRHFDLKGIEPIIQIRAQTVLGQRLRDRPVGRGDEAEIGLQRARAAQRPVLALLQHAQETRLQIRGHVGNLVEKQRASFRRRNHSWEIIHRARKRAFHVTKQLSLDHGLRKRRAIELHHRFASAPAARVNIIGNHFLARAAFARDQHVGFRRRHRADQFVDLLHRFAFENGSETRLHHLQTSLQLLRLFTEFFRLAQQRLLFQSFLHQAEQLFRRVRFADEMESAALDRLDRVVYRIVRRQDDYLRARELGFDFVECLQSLGVG